MTSRSSRRRLRNALSVGAAVSAAAVAAIVPAGVASANAKLAAKKPHGSPVVFHAVLSETGSAASLGKTEAKALQILAKEVNSQGGIKGHPMKVTIKDNGSVPAQSVSLAAPWVSQKVPFILNGSVVATNKAVDALATPTGPFIYDLSPGTHPAPGSMVFSAGIGTNSDAQAILTYLKAKGLTKIAIMNGLTGSGVDGYTQLSTALKTSKLSGLTVTTHQTFTPTAVSVSTQMAAVKASNPQALIIWVTGTPLGTVLQAMSSLGMDTLPTVTTDGNASYTLLTKLSSLLPKQLYFPTGPLYMPTSVLKGKVKTAVATFDKFVAAAGGHGGDPWGLSYDPGLLMVGALRKLGINPSPKKILNYMEHLKKVPGIYGLYTTSVQTHRGLGTQSIRMAYFNGSSFVPVSAAGGVPLKSSTSSGTKK